jgi:hypothetical protein
MVGNASGAFSAATFEISGDEPSGSLTKELIII